jgi:hypothetical protein
MSKKYFRLLSDGVARSIKEIVPRRLEKHCLSSATTRKALPRKREILSNYITCSIHDNKRKCQFCVSGSAAGFPTDEKSIADD